MTVFNFYLPKKLKAMGIFCLLVVIGTTIMLPLRMQAEEPNAEIQYLSEHGPKDAVP